MEDSVKWLLLTTHPCLNSGDILEHKTTLKLYKLVIHACTHFFFSLHSILLNLQSQLQVSPQRTPKVTVAIQKITTSHKMKTMLASIENLTSQGDMQLKNNDYVHLQYTNIDSIFTE